MTFDGLMSRWMMPFLVGVLHGAWQTFDEELEPLRDGVRLFSDRSTP